MKIIHDIGIHCSTGVFKPASFSVDNRVLDRWKEGCIIVVDDFIRLAFPEGSVNKQEKSCLENVIFSHEPGM